MIPVFLRLTSEMFDILRMRITLIRLRLRSIVVQLLSQQEQVAGSGMRDEGWSGFREERDQIERSSTGRDHSEAESRG